MNLIRTSVKRPIAITMIILIFVVIGLYSLSMLPMELMPEIEMPMALIFTSYPNVGSQEVENLVTKPIESSISSVSGAKSITSQSSEGSSMIMMEFSSSVDMDDAVQALKDNVSLIEDYLPDGANDPMVLKLDTSMMPVAMLSVSYEGADLVQAKKYIEDNVQNKIEAIDGVASVTVSGAQDRIIEIEIDPEKLFGYGVSMTDIATAIASQNINLPSGETDSKGKVLPIRVAGKFSDVEEINTIPLVTDLGQIIYLKDVATVNDTYSDIETISRLNGENSLSLTISSESDANTVDVVNSILKELDKIKSQTPKFSYNVIMEQASYIEDSISSVTESAVSGALLAVFILLLFLGNFKTSMVVGISMPISVITTFIGMYFSGMTLNVVSLGGLCLGIGMLVDNAVVVLENIFRRRDECNDDKESASINGTSEVISAVVASVITTCIVYVPILFIDNMMAVMFKQLAFTIIFSQIASLIVTIFIVPMLSAKLQNTTPNKKLGFILNPFSKFMDKFYVYYDKGLRWVLSNRKKFMLSVIAVFLICLFILGQIGMTLMPSSDEGTLSVNIELPQGVYLDKTNNLTLEIEKIISENENVDTIFSNVGSGSMSMLGQSSDNASSLTVTLKDDRKKTTDEVAQDIRQSLSNIAGANITVSASSSMSGMDSNKVQFEFTGNDDKILEKYVLEAKEILSQVEGVVETETSISEKKPELQINIDSSKASRYGMSTATVSSYISGVLNGKTASQYTQAGQEYDINIVYPDNYVKNAEGLKNLKIKTMTGQWISLSDIADVSETSGHTTLTRIDQKRVITLSAKIFDTDMGTVSKVFNEKLDLIPVPEGVSRSTGGTYEVMIESMLSLLLAIFLGILLMYLVMAAQFESLIEPLEVLFTIPLAMIGVVLGLLIARIPLSVVGCIGILMLTGIIVNNAIVLIDFINTAKKEEIYNDDRTELLVFAGKSRMRAVLMTSLTSILGFLPMALALGSSGAQMMQPLAVVLIGGLAIGTFLTLFVIPVVYSIVDDKQIKHKQKKLSKINKSLSV
ncbi:MAG: efflux RND transporter permease subunit [Ruminococcaceae bacterium]|nr:efflux RND transporter permease subunit [Oscillospiraceae bacterium]